MNMCAWSYANFRMCVCVCLWKRELWVRKGCQKLISISPLLPGHYEVEKVPVDLTETTASRGTSNTCREWHCTLTKFSFSWQKAFVNLCSGRSNTVTGPQVMCMLFLTYFHLVQPNSTPVNGNLERLEKPDTQAERHRAKLCTTPPSLALRVRNDSFWMSSYENKCSSCRNMKQSIKGNTWEREEWNWTESGK